MLIATKTSSVALHQQDKGKGKERECHHRGVVSSVPVSSPMPAQSIGVAATASATVDTALNPNPGHPQQEPQQLQQQQHPPQQPRGVSELVPIQERLLAIQLAHYASQHHTSEYNRLKFGPRGSPTGYIPVSLQDPLYVHKLKKRQGETYKRHKMWYYSDREPDTTAATNTATEFVKNVPSSVANQESPEPQTLPAMMTEPSLNIQQEISAAIDSQISIMDANLRPAKRMKTSQSHPINISMVIPSEYLPMISSSLSRYPSSTPCWYDIPQSLHLNRITAVYAVGSQNPNAPFQYGHGQYNEVANQVLRPQPTHPNPPILWAQPGGTELLQNALQGEVPPTILSSPKASSLSAVPIQALASSLQRVMPEVRPVRVALPPRPSSLPLPASVSPPQRGQFRRSPRSKRAKSAPPSFREWKEGDAARKLRESRQHYERIAANQRTEVTSDGAAEEGRGNETSEHNVTSSTRSGGFNKNEGRAARTNGYEKSHVFSPGESLTQNPAYLKKQTVTLSLEGANSQKKFGNSDQIGNFYLSSCPGKKVRLSGPVKGRGAICRDLRSDLERVRDLGVGCIVCCLGDTELEFLGVTWAEYQSITNELGLDVLRMPMAEGLSPPSPAVLDCCLSVLINFYTHRGISILAHCRGGVGRAGLVSCCWMLKLGLCGWKDPDLCKQTHPPPSSCSPGTPTSLPAYDPTLQQQIPFHPVSQSMNADPGAPAPGTLPVPRVCRATVQLLQNVLLVVRRRRNLKAVETYEQVRFIVDYIEYLDNKRRQV